MKLKKLFFFLLLSTFTSLSYAEIKEIVISSPGSTDDKFFEPYENDTEFKIVGEINVSDLQNFRLSCYKATYIDLSEANFHAYEDAVMGQSYKDNEFPESLSNMTALETLILPKSITKIKNFAITFLDNLKSLTLPGETVPETESGSLDKKLYSKTTLYVPASLLEQYKTTSPYSSFTSILPISEESTKKPLITIESISNKGVKSSLCLIGKTTSLQVDFGDGNLQDIAVSNEVPNDINQVKYISFTTPVENGVVKIYGEGIKLLVFNYPNKIKSIHVENAPNLEVLDVNNTGLTAIDLSQNSQLRWLYLFGNMDLNTIDLSHNPNLENLQLQYTGVSDLVLGQKPNLHTLITFNSSIVSIDASGCPSLVRIIGYKSSLQSINVAGCTKLQTLWLGESRLNQVIFDNNSSLEDLQLYSNKGINTMDFSKLKNLKKLYVDNTSIESLDLTSCPKIEKVDAYRTKLKKILFSNTATPKSCLLWGNQLDACALDYMFLSLGKTTNNGSLVLKSGEEGNPGIATSKTSIALKKGYRVLKMIGTKSSNLVGDGTGCPKTSDDIKPITHHSKMVYPTITSGDIHITDYERVANIKVYSVEGKLLAEPTPRQTIDLSSLMEDQVVLLIETVDGKYESCRIFFRK